MHGLYELERGCGRCRLCPSPMGTVVLRLARMRRALGPTRGQRSAGCGLVPLLPFGLSPAVSAAVALPRSFLPDAVFSPTAADFCAHRYVDTALRACPGHVHSASAASQCECGWMVRRGSTMLAHGNVSVSG